MRKITNISPEGITIALITHQLKRAKNFSKLLERPTICRQAEPLNCLAYSRMTFCPCSLQNWLGRLGGNSWLIFALSRDQISTRRASVLSYVAVSLMHGFRTLQQKHLGEMGESRFDPLPWTWKWPRAHRPDFVNIDDARGFYAQQYADKMREKAKQTLAEKGLHSHYYPYTADLMPPNRRDDDKPMTEAEAIASYNRLRT